MKKNSVIKNSAWIVFSRIIQTIFGMVINMFSARYLGPSNYGIINYAASVISFAAPFMKLGFPHVLVKEIINNPSKEGETLGTAIFFNIISASVCIIGIYTYVKIAHSNEFETILVCMLYSLNLFFQATEMIQYWFQAKLISQYTSIASLFAYVVVSIYKVYLLISQKNVYWFAVSQSIDYAIISAILIYQYKKLSNQRLSVSVKQGVSMFNRSKFFIISSLMITFFAQTDKLMLKHMIGDEATGIYSAAITCAGISSFVFGAIIDSMRPVVLESKKLSEKKYEEVLTLLFSIIFFISLLQSVCMTVLAKPIIYILYGEGYAQAVNVLRLVVWYTTFSYLGSARGVWILAESKQDLLWMINMSGAILNIILNFILIPIIGISGAALASVITQVFTNFIIGFFVKPLKECNKLIIKGMNYQFFISNIKTFIVSFKK